MGHHSAFFRKAFHMSRFLGKIALRDKQREVGVLMACFLESAIQICLHGLPDGIAMGLDHHAASDC